MKTIPWKKIFVGLILIVVGFLGGLLVMGFPPSGKGYHTIDEIELKSFIIKPVGTCPGFPSPVCPNCNTVCSPNKCAFTNPLYSAGGGVYYSYELESCDWTPNHNYDQCICWAA